IGRYCGTNAAAPYASCHTTCPRCATQTTAPGTVPPAVACRRKASSACTRAPLDHTLGDDWGLAQDQLRPLYRYPHAEWECQGLRAMTSGEAVEDGHSQIAQDVEDDVFHTVCQVTVRLNALHTAKHQAAYPLEDPGQLQ